jgi:hypothetical protein
VRIEAGHTLLELVISLAISALLWIVLDRLYLSIWKTRTLIEQGQDRMVQQQLPNHLFSHLLFHAGNLGCRALRDGLEIKTSSALPADFFLHKGKAVQINEQQLWVQEINPELMHEEIPEGTVLQPKALLGKSDWLLISDCAGAEVIPYGGFVSRAYLAPVTLSPVLLRTWFVKNQVLYRQTLTPFSSPQPVLSGLVDWHWEKEGEGLKLSWTLNEETLEYHFELGNSPCC